MSLGNAELAAKKAGYDGDCALVGAVSLLYKNSPTSEELENADLFMVSEIKRPKDGAMEIKFFDRLKALEKLGCRNDGDSGAKQLFDAIDRSAGAVGNFKYDD